MASSQTVTRTGGLLAFALALVACGGGAEGDGGAAATARPAQAQVTVTQADVATPFQLQAGRYKFGWTAPECKGVDFTIAGSSQGFTYAKKSSLPAFSAIMSAVPEDTYTLTQADAGCTTWTVQIDRLGG